MRLRIFRLTAYILTTNWAIGLTIFFINPKWTKAQINSAYNWATDKQFAKPFKKTVSCQPYETMAWRMNDRYFDYRENAIRYGVERQKGVGQIRKSYQSGKLALVESNEFYVLDTMYYSYAFVTPATKQLIDTIAQKFQEKLQFSDLKGAQLTITSLLRTENSVARLRKRNRNALKNSAHLHGTAFDVSYATYFKDQNLLSPAQATYLREVLAEVLYELREDKRCWVTYEINQTCFHIVSRTEEV